MALFGGRVFNNIINLRESHTGLVWGLTQLAWSLQEGRAKLYSRDTRAEAEEMHRACRDCWGPRQKLREGHAWNTCSLLRAFRGSPALLTP